MDYKEIKLCVANQGIHEYKIFEGIKLYSAVVKSEDEKGMISKRVYVTKKKNYVYYERTDANWNYWNIITKFDTDYEDLEVENHIIFEVFSDLKDISKYLGEEIVKKLIEKEKNNELVEYMDI